MSEKQSVLPQVRYRTVRERVDRLHTVMKEFRIKHISKLLDILVDSNIDELENKLVYIDKKQADEIRKIVLQTSNDIAKVRTLLYLTANNANQIARNSNVCLKKTSKANPEDLADYKKWLEKVETARANNSATLDIYIEQLEYAKAKLGDALDTNHYITDKELKNLKLDTASIQSLIAELNAASAKLGEVEIKLMS